ncbi:MAG: hypothetical protein A4E55_01601 [Pelotomaculum sp. PtaU1.Bin035]|nr:MAG: hypothetical protein A4E55_01601 [Pelotomaculum sp. PtaU1.Bin035]
MKQKPVLCIRGCAGPSLIKQLARYLDRQITACQEWLEGPDKPSDQLITKAVLITSAVYIAAHLILRICRGG